MEVEVRQYFGQACPGGKLRLPKPDNLRKKVGKAVRRVKSVSWSNVQGRGYFLSEEVQTIRQQYRLL